MHLAAETAGGIVFHNGGPHEVHAGPGGGFTLFRGIHRKACFAHGIPRNR